MEFLFLDAIFLANFGGLSTIITTAVVIFASSYFIKGISVDGPISALIAGIALAVVSFFIGGILDTLATPLSFLTLGLFRLVVDAIIVYVAHMLLKGFRVENFGAAFLLVLAITAIQYVF